MKVIFLDIDGVLNYDKWYKENRDFGNTDKHNGDLDPLCINRIIKICDNTDAKVVITSEWRLSWNDTTHKLSKLGLNDNYVIDKTLMYMWSNSLKLDGSRGSEIEEWLETHKECTNYVIIDDRTDFSDEQFPHFIQIDPMYGIQDFHVDMAISILNKY